MKKIKLFMLTLVTLLISNFSFSQTVNDSIIQKVEYNQQRLDGINERLTTTEGEVFKLNKIKFSGYIQSQWEKYENPTTYPSNTFYLRRVRLKATYDLGDDVKFVLQPDFSTGALSLKDAYAQFKLTKNLSLWAGQFNRPNYEVEYSSSQREVPERSKVIKSLYPGERAIGAKLEYIHKDLKVQAALLNGNDNMSLGNNTNLVNKDYDNYKDVMLRAVYSVKLSPSIGLDFGGNTYYGFVKASSDKTLNSDYTYKEDVKIGNPLKRNWVGTEAQLYFDFLGGMVIKGEYMMGTNAYTGYQASQISSTSTSTVMKNDSLYITNTTTKTTSNTPNQLKDFSGYYVYLVKNIGKKNQFAVRYDVYDPNSKLTGTDLNVKNYNNSVTTTTNSTTTSNQTITNNITKTTTSYVLNSGKSDMRYETLTLAWQYYLDQNIRITLGYEIPMNEKTLTGKVIDKYTINNVANTVDYNKVFPQNTLTLRIQAKF